MTECPVQRALDHCAAPLGASRRLLVAYSGGLDSHVLLHAVAAWRQRADASPPIAVHADHQLNEASRLWAKHCADVCSALNLFLIDGSVNVRDDGRGPEAAAREARYSWFESLIESGDVLLLAQHQDDQTETVMLRLLRGAGPQGLAGMPRIRELGAGKLLRPFVELPRSRLLDYAQAHSLSWIDDPSNADSRFDRNYLRNEVLPLLESRWPGYRKTVTRAAALCAELVESGDNEAERCVSITGDPALTLASLPEGRAACRHVLHRWLTEMGVPIPSHAKLVEFVRQLKQGRAAQLQQATYVLERFQGLVLCRPVLGVPAPEPISLTHQFSGPWLGHDKLDVQINGAENSSYVLRTRRPGDRFVTSGGQSSPLKDMFQRLGIPPCWRAYVPLLVCEGDLTGSIVALGPYAINRSAVPLGVSFHWRAPVVVGRNRA
ncbi:MAG: tRNA lysidine(34) synthetase TilS [Pseudomonadota bacterium]